MKWTRRDFLSTAVTSSATSLIAFANRNAAATATAAATAPEEPHDHAAHIHPRPLRPVIPRLPALICKVTGTAAIDEAYQMLCDGRDTLDAALHVTTAQENDPDDHSTGLGGLPTEEGDVQLDAWCMHGPTRRAAGVACVSGIKNVSQLARAAMEQFDYPLLVGAGAQGLALSSGFKKEELLTARSRKMWATWQRIKTTAASWGPGISAQQHFLPSSQLQLNELVRKMEPLAVAAGLDPQWTWRAAYDSLFPAAEPLYVCALNGRNELSAAATTSGLPWRRSGLVSDIAITGSGCCIDPAVGSAGSGGNAPANMKIMGARSIIDNMRSGMSAEEAGMEALRRIATCYKNDVTALRFVEMMYYIMRIDGTYAGVSLWQGDKTGHARQYTIHDGMRRTEDCRFLLDGSPANGCAVCRLDPV